MMIVEDVIHALGVPRTYIGFRHLNHAILVAMENEDNLLSVTKRIYPVVAEKFQTNATCVERNLRTVIKVCWDRGNRQFLDQIAGYKIPQKPSTGEFISMLAVYMKRHSNNEPS